MSDDGRDGGSTTGGSATGSGGNGSSGNGSSGNGSTSRPVVTGTAAGRYNAPRPDPSRSDASRTDASRVEPPSEAERTQKMPVVPAGEGQGGASRSSGGSDQPPWQRSRGTAVVDAPTSSIKRRDAATDMPDLSTATPARPQPQRSSSSGSSGSSGSDRTPSPSPTATQNRVGSSAARAARKGPRRASLQLKHIDPWSTLKLSLVLSVAMFLVWMVAVGVLYLVLDSMGVWDRLNSTFTEFVSSSDPTTTAAPLVGPGRIFGIAAIIGAVNIVLLTALATIGSFIYNLSSDLAGGIEVTLTERD